MDLRTLPGVLPRVVVEGALPLERADPHEVGLLISICPCCPEGVPFRPHRLRAKIISPELVELFCPLGCSPQMLKATIYEMFNKSQEKEAA